MVPLTASPDRRTLLPRGGAADSRGGGAQQIPEQHRLQLLGGHLREGDVSRQLDRLPGGGGLQDQAGGLGVHRHPHLAVHHLAGLLVVAGLTGLAGEGVRHGLQVQSLGLHRLPGGLHRLRSGHEGLGQPLPVQSPAVPLPGGEQAVSGQLIAGVHGLLVKGSRHLLHRGGKPVLVVVHPGLQGGLPAQQAPEHGPAVFQPAQGAALPAHVPGCLGGLPRHGVSPQLRQVIGSQVLAVGGDSHHTAGQKALQGL